ncbi:MMS19 nucleotide excision repair protein [Dirofilaria immitis]
MYMKNICAVYLIITVLSVICINSIFGLNCYHGVSTEYFHSSHPFKIQTCQAGNFCIKYHRVDFRKRRSFTIKSCDDYMICAEQGCTVGSVATKFMGYLKGPFVNIWDCCCTEINEPSYYQRLKQRFSAIVACNTFWTKVCGVAKFRYFCNMDEEKEEIVAEVDEDSSFVNQWVAKLSNGKPFILRVFIESFESDMKSKDRIRQENSLKRICSVISKLPQSYPWQLSQVELLMNFFLMNYDNFDAPNYFMLAALKRLLMSHLHISTKYIRLIVETLFRRGQVQICFQKERYLFYQILDALLNQYYKELSEDVYFVSYFISSISGERDPRCLILVFRLFCTLCKYFKSGDFPRDLFDVHATELFDVVACYYPIEFNYNSKERTEITKELLISGCESCLLIDEEFAPFVFELIIEKLIDSEYSLDTKLEVCSFLAKACAVFPCTQLVENIERLCAGVRSIIFSFSKNADDKYIPKPIETAVSSMLKALEEDSTKSRKEQIEYVCQEFIEKGEMFVLQTELGLTDRILAFLEILLKSSKFSYNIVFENVFSWLLSLCKGDTASSATNKSEVIDIGLKLLCYWIDIADDFKQSTLMRKFHISLIEMLDKYDREIAQLARYKLLKVCIGLHVRTDELLEKCKVSLRKSFDFVCNQNKELRNNCLIFVHVFAAADWTTAKDLITNEIESSKEIFHITPLLWSIIHDTESLDFALSYLGTLFPSTSACSDDFQEIFLEMFKKNRSESSAVEGRLLKQTLTCFFVRLEIDDSDLEAQSKFLQEIGLIINDRTHLEGLHLIQEKLKNCSSLLPGLYLYIIQSSYSDELVNILTELVSTDKNLTWYKSLIMAAAVNKSLKCAKTLNQIKKLQESFEFVDRFKCKARLCAALLLIGHPEGSTYFVDLLHDLVQYDGSEDIHILTDTLVDMLTFDTCYSDPVKCKYRTTILWRQRIFCQLVPIYVRSFNDLRKEFRSKQIVLFPLLSPFFALAASSTAVMNDKYMELLPILCAALDSLGLNLYLEEQIISGLTALLKNATAEQLGDDFLLKVLPRLQHCLENNKNMMAHLAALECLQLIAQRWSSTTLLPFYDPIVRSLIKTSGSQKRIVRKAVADARNLWELLPTK